MPGVRQFVFERGRFGILMGSLSRGPLYGKVVLFLCCDGCSINNNNNNGSYTRSAKFHLAKAIAARSKVLVPPVDGATSEGGVSGRESEE